MTEPFEVRNLPLPLMSVNSSLRTSFPSHISRCPSGFEDPDIIDIILEDLIQRTLRVVLPAKESAEEMAKEQREEKTTEPGKSLDIIAGIHSVPTQNSSMLSSFGSASSQWCSAGIGLQDFPDQLLEAVLQKLPFASVSRAGGACRSLRRAAAAVLRRELRSLVPRIEAMTGRLEALVREQLEADSCLVSIMMRLMLHTLLRLLLGEARMLRAIFWRYVRDDEVPGPGDVSAQSSSSSGGRSAAGAGSEARSGATPLLCFPAGDVLDEMERLLGQAASANFSADLEPEVASALFMLSERFLDYFETSVEPLLRDRETPFGVKVVDLLGACDSADCSLSVLHGASEQPYVARMRFELRDVSAVESPPPFDGQLPASAHLRMLLRYLRNNVRWSNFFRPMRELWDLQDELENRWEIRPWTGERRDISRHHELHQEVMEAVRSRIRRGVMRVPAPLSSIAPIRRSRSRHQDYEQVVVSAFPPQWHETFSRRASPIARTTRLGLSCDLQLSGARKALLPLDLEFLDERRVRRAMYHPGLSPQASRDSAPPPALALCASGVTLASPPKPPKPPLPPLPPPPTGGELAPDWGPWFRLRLSNPPPETFHGFLPGPWADCGEVLRAGGEYGFRGEIRVTFPPRALSSIVTETVIVVQDTGTEASLSSDRRFV